jgi:hypothetical protein
MIRAVPRGLTTCVDAYLTPIIKQYVYNFKKGFKEDLKGVNVNFMQRFKKIFFFFNYLIFFLLLIFFLIFFRYK